MSDNTLVEITGLWQNKSTDGGVYLKGTMGQAAIVIFPNKNKRPNTKDPEFKMYVSRKNKPSKGITSEF